MKRKIIDISTEELRNEVYKKFDSFKSKNEAHIYFGISDNKIGSEYLKQIANEVGFDLNTYKERRKKPIKYCKQCGKEIVSKNAKEFCCRSCATIYGNLHRDKSVYVKIGKILASRYENIEKKDVSENHCVICGEKIPSRRKYCDKCKKEHRKGGHNCVCIYCGKTFIGRHKESKFCSFECFKNYQSEKKINEWVNNNLKIDANSKLPSPVRRYLLEKCHYKCEECGFEGYNKKTGNTILQFHHKDGNSSNNTVNNIQVLCPNCHAMTENFMNLNKGHSARDKRYKKNIGE